MQLPTSTSAQHHAGQLAEYDALLSKLRDIPTSGIHTDNTYLSAQPFSPLAREFDKGSANIAEVVRSIGAEVRADRLLCLTHILKYYGLAVPQQQNATTLVPLVRELEERIANHRLSLEQGLDISRLLTTDDRLKINQEIRRVLGDEETPIIDRLAREVEPAITLEQLQLTPEVCLLRLLDSHKARYLTQRLIDVLEWYGARPGEASAPGIGPRLLAAALLAWYCPWDDEEPDTIAGYSLQQRSNYGKSYNRLRHEFETHLLDSMRASTALEKAVLARLLLRQFPVEFQVRNIPDDLPYATSVVWVNFVHGARLAHALDPGLLQRLTFQQLVDLPLCKSQSTSKSLLDLTALTRLEAAREWTLATGAIDPADENAQALTHPTTALEKYTEQLNAAIIRMAAEPPQRLDLAKKCLVDALGEVNDPLSTRLMRDDGNAGKLSKRSVIDTPPIPGTTYPLVEVYASGGLSSNTKWYVSDDGKIGYFWISLSSDGALKNGLTRAHTGTRLHSFLSTDTPLPDISALFDKQFSTYLDKAKDAYETLIKNQLVTLPWVDRQALEHGEVRVYTLREETSKIKADDETSELILPLRARMGFVLRADYRGKASFYECLPRAGLIRIRTDVSVKMVGGYRRNFHAPNAFNDDYDVIPITGGNKLPFDWEAHKKGIKPKQGATCYAILEQLGDTLSRSLIPPAHHDISANLTLSSSRSLEIASFISKNLFYLDEKELRASAWGETKFERDRDEKHWLYMLQPFIPFWGSLDDLQSDNFGDRVLGAIGLIVDIISFAMPLGKFAAGSMRLVIQAGRMGIRATLPSLGKLSANLLTTNLRNLNPLDALPALLKSTARGGRAGGRALVHLENKALFKLKKLAGQADEYDFSHGLTQVTDPGHWRPLTDADQLAIVKGIEDVPVRNVVPLGFRHYLIDPLSSRPFGPMLSTHTHDLSLGRSSYHPLKKSDEHVFVVLPEKASVREVLEIDGRTTVLIDDLPYRLDADDLRHVDLIDDSSALTLVPCRPRRTPNGSSDCLSSFVTSEPAPTPQIGSFDETKGYAPWFGDRVSVPVARLHHEGQFLTHEGNLYHIIDNVPTLYKGDITQLGFARKWLVPSREIPASLMFRKGIYSRIEVKGVYEGAEDSHRIGAILVPSLDESSTYVFTRINTDKYYVATVPKGQSLSEPLTLKRLLKPDMAEGTLGEELLLVYTGSLSANNIARIHGVEAISRAMKTMEEIAIPIGTNPIPASSMKHLKVDTSPGEALMFDHSTRMIVTQLPQGATSWSRSKDAPEALRQRTANIFDTLFGSPTIDASKANSALRINQTMEKLHQLIPRRQRSYNPRNIAYAEVMTTTGQREIYVSVSGGQQATSHLPLFKQNLGADQVRVGDSVYFNIDLNQHFPITSLDVTDQGKLLAVPTTIKDIGTYKPVQTVRPTSLDSESKLIRVIREKYPDSAAIKSIDVATTMRPCESCSIVVKEFGYDGGANALHVLWN
jgi:hypothetical protein